MSAQIEQLLADLGVERTIYSLVMPETEAAVERVVDGVATERAGEGRERFLAMYREAWTRKQDHVHEEMFEEWRSWVRPVAEVPARFAFSYPTAGASEGIKELVYSYGNRARREGFEPAVHVFEGEYEGFRAYAEAVGVPVVLHDRGRWRESIGSVEDHHELFLSEPSAIDGRVWGQLEQLCLALSRHAPNCRVHVDLTYVGCVAREFEVALDAPNVRSVLFSLSKPMGIYYHRAGGLLSTAEVPGLYGNRWFKNLFSLALATELMRSHGVHELPARYRDEAQIPAIELVREPLGLDLRPSDVFLLATAPRTEEPSSIEQYLTRAAGSHSQVRCCLSPRMSRIVSSRSAQGGEA